MPFLKTRFSRIVLFLAHAILFIGIGSRLFGLLFFLYLGGIWLRDGALTKKSIGIFGLGCLFGFIFSLGLRTLKPHGVWANLEHLISFRFWDTDIALTGLSYVSNFSVFSLAYALENAQVTIWDHLIVAVPFGRLWIDLSPFSEVFRLIHTSPVSALGSLSVTGPLSVFCVFFVLGILGAYFQARPVGIRFFDLMIVGIFSICVLFSAQYNFQGFSRMIFLSFALSILGKFIRGLIKCSRQR